MVLFSIILSGVVYSLLTPTITSFLNTLKFTYMNIPAQAPAMYGNPNVRAAKNPAPYPTFVNPVALIQAFTLSTIIIVFLIVITFINIMFFSLTVFYFRFTTIIGIGNSSKYFF